MADYTISFWQRLVRPPSGSAPEIQDVIIKALSCKNAFGSFAVLIKGDVPAKNASLVISDLNCGKNIIEAMNFEIFKIGFVDTKEAGSVGDILFPATAFDIASYVPLYMRYYIPSTTAPGIYKGSATLIIDGKKAASKEINLEVAPVTLPNINEGLFYLNVWMNPAPIAAFNNMEIWSDEHFELMKPYICDLAMHGQKTAVVPICSRPWYAQTTYEYPSAVVWKKTGESWSFDFDIFDKYVELYESYGVDTTIHCYSPVQGPGTIDFSDIDYVDTETGDIKNVKLKIGSEEHTKAWKSFFDAFEKHLIKKHWFDKTYIAFDEKDEKTMAHLIMLFNEYAPNFKLAYAGCLDKSYSFRFDDISYPLQIENLQQAEPYENIDMGAETSEEDDKLTTFYVCCSPQHPNTFCHSPLIESRIIPLLAIKGGYNGLLRWSYNDWSDKPFDEVAFENGDVKFPSGDTFFVYPSKDGPVSSLRWDQIREGIQDFELAAKALEQIETDEQMNDYEQAISIACRDLNGVTKSTGDLEIAKRLLIPIAKDYE